MRLELLDKKHLESIKEYKKEMLEAGSSLDGCGGLEKFDDINEWYDKQKAQEDENNCPKGHAPDWKYLCVDNGEVIGFLSYRHPIEGIPILEEYGGHVGYSVKPSRRRQGVATWQLKELIKVIREEGELKRIMVTCNVENEGSRKTILACGGKYQDTNKWMEETVERYWIEI